MGDVALGPLFDALRCNTQLRTLQCAAERIEYDKLTEAFVLDRVLPAVHANTGLRLIELGSASDNAWLCVRLSLHPRPPCVRSRHCKHLACETQLL